MLEYFYTARANCWLKAAVRSIAPTTNRRRTVVKKSRRFNLPNKMGKLLIPKNADAKKLKEKYPEDQFTVTSVITSDGKPLGFLVKKLNPCPTCGNATNGNPTKKPAAKKKQKA
jgi:hypothetical protein